MKTKLILLTLLCASGVAYGQFSVGYHHSGFSFLEFSYELNEKFVPSARLGTNREFEDLSLELDLLYQLKKTQEYEFYFGAGVGLYSEDGYFILPVGLRFFPFVEKNFGFHFEAAPMIGDVSILRGTVGIRYRFPSSGD
jgi:hypothetical protein